jgi:peptidoglycan/LPS O-acetylase OafA/YrhL
MPALVLVVVAIMAVTLLTGPRSKIEDHGKCSLAALLYVTNWLTAFQLIPWSPLSHTWSLSSEEQFYLAWPFLLWGLLALKAGRRTTLGLVAATIVALTLYRAWLWHLHHSSIRVYYSLDTHADGLITGCLLALLFSFAVVTERSCFGPWGWPSLIVILGVSAVGTTDSSAIWYGGLSAVNVAAALVIAAIMCDAEGSLAKAFRWGPLAWMGRLSYGIFLWHYPIFLQVEKMLGSKGRALSITASLAATALAATTSFYLLERPLLRLKKHRSAGPPQEVGRAGQS